MGLYQDIIAPHVADLTTGLEALAHANNALRDNGFTSHIDPGARLAASRANAAMLMLNRVVFHDYSPDIASQLKDRTGGKIEPGRRLTIAPPDVVYDSDGVRIPDGTYAIAHLRDMPDGVRQRVTLRNTSSQECFVAYRDMTLLSVRDEQERGRR